MNIEGTGQQIGRIPPSAEGRPHKAVEQHASGRSAKTTAQPPPREPAGDETPAPSAESPEDTRGVIRLLEARHFKGVADLRLRINFFDELSARAGAAAIPVAEEHAGQLAEGVANEVQEVIGILELDEEQLGAIETLTGEFEESVQTALQESTADGVLDRDALADALGSAFEALVQQLEPYVVPPEDPEVPAEEPVDGTDEPETDPPVEGAEEPATLDPLEALKSAFEEALTGLLEATSAAGELSPLGPAPAGNGQAYEKFLAIYRELTGESPNPDKEPSDDEQINVVT